ncbi:DUF3180 domain-containing protein [Actinopolyspora erythraea]|uniref:DUF3180 domain-containing protein n=1 Tax=Actinopolyspora erythraea TaxID=414996 RepID=A0A099DCF3_9ACTN|nr:DUF3180 domain-containing protein [Actinopolyspora erythraea]ASU77217.1 DUF3180 domain-containing protein [Actinopolyspora erythraea]KGI83085.1 membrane protein [Actinopolyspora erythraea]
MSYTSARDLLGAALLAAVLVYGLVRLFYGALPPLPVAAGGILVVVAIVDAVLAVVLRPRAKHRSGSEPLDPMMATRIVALAKASSLAGALMGGAWASLLLYLLVELRVFGSDTIASAVGVLSAAALTGAGLWLEWAMRNPDEPQEDDDEG